MTLAPATKIGVPRELLRRDQVIRATARESCSSRSARSSKSRRASDPISFALPWSSSTIHRRPSSSTDTFNNRKPSIAPIYPATRYRAAGVAVIVEWIAMACARAPVAGDTLVLTAREPGASIPDLERALAEPLEDTLAELPGVRGLRTTIDSDGVVVEVTLATAADALLEPALTRVRSRLPPAASVELTVHPATSTACSWS